MKKLILSIAAIFLFSIFATGFVSACTENQMECVDTSAGCKHRTCNSNGNWPNSYVEFEDNSNGSYGCTANQNGGGERCHFTKLSLLPNLQANSLARVFGMDACLP